MLKKVLIPIFIIAVFILAFYIFDKNASQDKQLANEIDKLLKQNETEINLRTLTNFKWSNVEIFIPYTSNEEIEEIMKIKFKGDNGGIDMLDNRYLLVFADDKQALKTVVLSAKHGIYSIKDHKILVVEK